MAYWLIKEEPTHYSFADLERDGTTRWDGVTNNLARQNLRQVRRGDRLLYYHTGNEKAIVGEAQAISDATADSESDDPKSVVVLVKAVRRLPHPVPLQVIKSSPQFEGWDLVRLPRLSVVPVTQEQWRHVQELSRRPGADG
jgi:predicted RNA-binding protein with PUA-like domain